MAERTYLKKYAVIDLKGILDRNSKNELIISYDTEEGVKEQLLSEAIRGAEGTLITIKSKSEVIPDEENEDEE